MNRVLLAIVFIFLLMFLGFCAGMFAGAFFVPNDSGLTGSPTVLFYGVAGLITGLIAAVVLIRFLKHTRLRDAVLIAGIVSFILISWFFYRIKQTAPLPGSQPTLKF